MPSFQYDAIRMLDRSKVTGLINAENEKEARELLREQDLLATKIKSVNDQIMSQGGKKINPVLGLVQRILGVGAKEKIAFTRNIGMMIRAGIPLTEALMYFEKYTYNPAFRSVISRLRNDILGGYSFSQALSKHKNLFDDVYVNVTKAGERSGELDQTMARLADMMIKAEKVKMKVIATSVYPIIVLCINFIVLMIMFYLVIPTFVEIYDKLGVTLPLITVIMFKISKFMRDDWFIALPLLGGSIYGIVNYIKTPTGKAVLDRLFLKIPVLDTLTKYVQNSNFISTFFVAFSAGLPITDAIYLATQTISHTQIREAYQNVNIKIQTGQRLAVSLADTGYVPDIVLLMISSGEESGDLERMLETSYEYLEEEIGHQMDILTSMMEPLMLMCIGLIVGCVALSIYLPLFGMYEHMGK